MEPLFDFPWLDCGTPFATLDAACVAPEAATEALDASSDVYALGVLLRVMLLGRAERDGESCGELDEVIDAMTREEREARPSMAEVELPLRTRMPAQTLPRSAASTQSRTAIGARLGRFELLRRIATRASIFSRWNSSRVVISRTS
jgi:hypothetical protein